MKHPIKIGRNAKSFIYPINIKLKNRYSLKSEYPLISQNSNNHTVLELAHFALKRGGGGQYCPPGRKSPVIGKKNKNFQK